MRYIIENNSGIVPGLIKWQTRGPASHAQTVFSDGAMFEATWPRVRQNPWHFDDYRWSGLCYEVFEVPTTPEQEAIMREFAEAQVGKGYDLTMVFRFVTRQQETRKSKGVWFCSEYTFATFWKGGVHLLERVEPWEVAPQHLRMSPIAKPIDRFPIPL